MSDDAEKRTGLKHSGIFTKAYWFRSPSLPEGKGFIVLQDKAGFLYLRKLVEREGLATPFSSIQELEMSLEMRLELVREEVYLDSCDKNGEKS